MIALLRGFHLGFGLAVGMAIEAGCRVGDSARAIAQKINRHHSVVAREITRNGWKIIGEDGEEQLRYNAHNAAVSTAGRMVRPKLRKLDESPTLRGVVVDCLARRWSPGRISAWLEHVFSDDESMRISHEAIYSALYIQGRGSLRAELEEVMKTKDVLIRGGVTRKRRARNAGVLTGRPWIKGAEITHRSPEADDRTIPGHWEGDLVIGKGGKSALITLVERTSRYTLLGRLPDEHSSHTVVATLQNMVKDLNIEQLKTITWDQGVEMAVTAQVQIKDGCQVFFCDPHSPWQRPTNENTNGEIRRRFYKKGTDFATVAPEHVAWVQNELNETPRQILGGATPREILNELFKRGASTA
ncbi:IS30 family transposase [Corynebacterium singulare]|nr:IS30 family transposase [Corynebacterium singulare]